MTYIFSENENYEILKTIGEGNTLSGWKTVIQEYPDSIITDKFKIVRLLDEKIDSEGNVYRWYEIENHYRQVDKTPSVDKECKQNAADIQYIAMMNNLEV